MASGDDRAQIPDDLDGTGLRVAVIRSGWNVEIVDRLGAGVERGLSALGVSDVINVLVPGCLELPMACRSVALSGRVDAIVTIGAVIRGETTHYELVSEGAAEGIQRVQLDTGIPITFGLPTVENAEQAYARSEGPDGHNVGEEAAVGAVQMARIVERFA
jgi:6,7-dimethyl-8-ribityllumazine synthase